MYTFIYVKSQFLQILKEVSCYQPNRVNDDLGPWLDPYWPSHSEVLRSEEEREPDMDRDDMFQKMFLI